MYIHKSDKFNKRSRTGPISIGKKGNQHYATAIILARKGQYTEAGNLLNKALNDGECSEVQALDLQARIYAQKGLYLEAEACWRKAKVLDGSSSAFDESIECLRRSRPPIKRFYKVIPYLLILVVFSVLLWQVELVKHDLGSRLDKTDIFIAGTREEIGVFRNDSQSLTQKVGKAVVDLDHALREYEIRIMAQLETIPTVTETSEDRKTIIDSLKGAVVEVGNTVANVETNSQLRDQKIAASVAGLDSRLDDMLDRVLERLNTMQTASRLTQERGAIIERTGNALAQLGEVVVNMESKLVEQTEALGSDLNLLSVEVQDLKKWYVDSSAGAENAGTKNPNYHTTESVK